MPNLTRFLQYSIAYRMQFLAVGGNRLYAAMIRDYIRPVPGCKLLDIGCGPGHFLPWLAGVDYTGIDISNRYIDDAKTRYGTCGRFICGDVNSVDVPGAPYDIVVAVGLLHHLSDDEVSRLSARVRQLLKPGGRWITVDGCYAPGQSALARYILSSDRGEFVREEGGYTKLAAPHFAALKASLRHDLLRIPYSHLVMECTA